MPRRDKNVSFAADRLSDPRVRRKATAALLGSALASGCAALLVATGDVRPFDKRSTDAARPTRSVAEPEQTKKKSGERLGAVPGQLTSRKMVPPYQVIDALTFLHDGVAVRLAHLEGPSRNEVCFDADGLMWACGLRARAAVHNEVAGKEIHCQLVSRSARGQELVDCNHGTDLARRLVELGWARPNPQEEQTYSAELHVAQREKRGLWNGGWHLRRP
jgi:endonuclease YncB( thermonuclease family)